MNIIAADDERIAPGLLISSIHEAVPGVMAVSTDKIAWDYYNWIRGDIEAINAYGGEYMSRYSWGECTHGGIEINATAHRNAGR